MFLKQVDLTTALRPAYLPDEVLLTMWGSMRGKVSEDTSLKAKSDEVIPSKNKIPDYQNGHVYLTSHRICYVDNQDPRKNSTAIDLKEVDRYEFYAGFLKSSAKITLVPKPPKRSSIQNRAISSLYSPSRSATASPLSRTDSPFHLPTPEPTPSSTATWICTICSFSNPVPSNFDPTTASELTTPLAPCLNCGIKPQFGHVLKAAISNAANRPSPASSVPLRAPLPVRGRTDASRPHSDVGNEPSTMQSQKSNQQSQEAKKSTSIQCPRCTFLNHPSLRECEICGARLSPEAASTGLENPLLRAESPGPTLNQLPAPGTEENESIKLSFRGGGEKLFHERLKGCMTQRKWLLQGAPPVPKPNRPAGADTGSSGTTTPSGERVKTAGIAGLEQRRLEVRKNNELAIGNAFEDLETLMASAKEIVALAESFATSNGNGTSETSAVANALGLVTTKEMLGGGSNSESLYISELSRNLAEFLTDDARGVLRKAGGIITLVDLWAKFNRARGGVELVSPLDFEKAARLWEKLKLPVRLREFKSGVLVVQASDRTDEKTIKTLLFWLSDLHSLPPDRELSWDWQLFGRGVTAQDAAENFGWSIGVAEEELEMAEERGALCREESIEGLKYWENWIDDSQSPSQSQSYNVI
ncbi:Vacuolar protein-sorting-associated protein 36 [Lachnellula cervina]|uniref:Vacuolar protein-sorting-associated protein 36 n=1 Tax=Lachnellula cervina TaxID=1316786 RepID=A0A7D8UY82_9HELO|nr:Vacuolar protein-sorting-associated protein 36 [Lachnellula cervina]